MRAPTATEPGVHRLHTRTPVPVPRAEAGRPALRAETERPAPHETSIRVLICDQLPLMREGLHTMLAATDDIAVTGTADGDTATLRAVTQSPPDVVLVGLGAPCEAAELVRRVQDATAGGPAAPPAFVVLYNECHGDGTARLIAADVRGLIRRDATRGEVIDAIHRVHAHQTAFSPEIVDQLRTWFLRKDFPEPDARDDETGTLTQREREILVLIGRGSAPEDIARLLFIGLTTVRTHIYRIRHKLSLKDRAQLVAYAYRTGLVGRPVATAGAATP